MTMIGRFLLRFLRCLMAAFSLCTLLQIDHPRFLLFLTLFAFVGAALWPIAEERFGQERTLYLSFLPIRYGLSLIVAIYGLAKICGLQFYTPLPTLDMPLGHLSGFELSWAFFSYSPTYAYFIGATQILGSLLLLSRRTTTLGAMLLLPIFVNIVFINFAFDIPVQFFSTLYLVLAFYLLTPDLARLCRLLLLNQGTTSRPLVGMFTKPNHQRIADGMKAAIVCLLYLITYRGMQTARKIFLHESAVTGAWRITADTDTASGLPWEKIYFERGSWGVVRNPDGLTRRGFVFLPNETEQTLEITFFGEEKPAIVARYERISPKEMVLSGTWNNQPFHVRLAGFEVRHR